MKTSKDFQDTNLTFSCDKKQGWIQKMSCQILYVKVRQYFKLAKLSESFCTSVLKGIFKVQKTFNEIQTNKDMIVLTRK